MNIGILIPGFSASESDWCIPVYLDLVRELAKNHDVRVFPFRYPYTAEPYTVYGAHVFPFGGGSYTSGMQRFNLLWQVERTLKRHHKAKPFDVLHAIWADETGYIANNIGAAIGVPTVVSIAGGEVVALKNIDYGLLLGRITAKIVNRAIRNATCVTAPSLYAANLVLQYMKWQNIPHENRLHVVRLGVDTELFTLPEIEVRPRQFLHVGSLNPVKRQDMLLNLIARIPGATLDIVGDGQLRGFLEEEARRLNIADRVIFHGEVAHDRLPAYYQESEFLLMTSQHEAFCMAAVEAAACGVQVFGSNVGILPEIGKTAPFGDLDRLLQLLLSRQRMHSEQQRHQRRWRVEQSLTVQHMVDNFVKVYQKALTATKW